MRKILYVLLALITACILFIYLYPSKNADATLHFQKHILFAHRAISQVYPENSLEGILYLKAHRVKAIEIDLRKTKDNKFVLFHDKLCDRLLASQTDINLLTYAEVQRKPLLFNGAVTTCKVPLFEDILNRISDSIIFYLDVKDANFEIADELAAIINKHKLQHALIVASTNASFCCYTRIKHPEIAVALEGFNAGKEWIYYVLTSCVRPHFLSSFHYKTNSNHINWLKKHHLFDAKIVFDVHTETFEKVKSAGFYKIMADYDSVVFSNNLR